MRLGSRLAVLAVILGTAGASAAPEDDVLLPPHRVVLLGAIRGYQVLAGPARVIPCPMQPSCSNYGYLAFRSRNPLAAFVMTADRLMRCGHDAENYRAEPMDGFLRLNDPLPHTDADVPGGGAGGAANPQAPLPPATDAAPAGVPESETAGEPDRLFNFAESLRARGDCGRAETEYLRLISYHPGSAHAPASLQGILDCRYQSRDYTGAIQAAQDVLAAHPGPEAEAEAVLVEAASYARLGNFDGVAETLDGLPAGANAEQQDRGALLRAYSHASQQNWSAAEAVLAGIRADSPLAASARDAQDLCREGRGLSRKNPRLAGLLGLLPGAGYLYSGYRGTALSSLIMNGLFAWATVEAFRHDARGLGATLAVLGSGWYFGNIYGSVVTAHRYNQKQQSDLALRFALTVPF